MIVYNVKYMASLAFNSRNFQNTDTDEKLYKD